MATTQKRYGVLDCVHNSKDLHALSYPVLQEMCCEIREFLVDSVSETGGHLASNLGIVELSVALERTFDSSVDRIIYDVGHQCYVHKILTGRKDLFSTLRKFGGISGFMKPSESCCDPCITGHASSSVSVALGMAHARSIKGQKYHVVALIGDGAMTGGMAYEALNSAGGSGEPLIVVLNDNNMSITPSVGALNRHLASLRVSSRYLGAKAKTKQILMRLPFGGSVINHVSQVKCRIKKVMLPTTLFEQMGFAYLGPVDGHDLKSVCSLLEAAKYMKKPVLLHVMTCKGKGYSFAEKHPEEYHGVNPFDPLTGESCSQQSPSFSDCFGDELIRLAANDTRVCAITAAMSSGTGLSGFAEQYPDRFFDVGIAEEHAVAMAAGMAAQGLKPVCTIYSTFLQRSYDQLIHDVAIRGDLNVIFAIDRAGIVGSDGATHNGVLDIAFLRSIPGMTIFCPSNYAELRAMMTRAIYHCSGPVAVRYPRGGEGHYAENMSDSFFVTVREPLDVPRATIVSYGIMVNEALWAAEFLENQGIAIRVVKINVISEEARTSFDELLVLLAGHVLILEDVVHNGSIGAAVAEELTARSCKVDSITLCNTGNRFLPHGSVREIYKYCGIDGMSVAEALLKRLGEHKD